MSPLQSFNNTHQSSKMFSIERGFDNYMQTKYGLASGFEAFEPFFLNIKDRFQNVKDIIHHARNVLKEVECNDRTLVVKSFAVPHYLNQVVSVQRRYRPTSSSKLKRTRHELEKTGESVCS